MIYKSWDRHWDDLSEFFKYPYEIRRAIYTTNAIESLNYQLRKVTKNQGERTMQFRLKKQNLNEITGFPDNLPTMPFAGHGL